ncbi:MAG TPA: WD40 repeat domain-containing protein [Tepidisphaeraceae bacterium]|nr:WD40 repeat domain-containing protein [Tepidisphaeraceae bacterium]
MKPIILACWLLLGAASPIVLGDSNDDLVDPVIIATAREQVSTSRMHVTVLAMAFSPDGKTFVSASTNDPTLFFRELPTGAVIAQVKTPGRGVRKIEFTRDGNRLVTFGDEVSLWNVKDRSIVAHWPVKNYATSYALSADGNTVALGRNASLLDRIGILELHDVQTGRLLWEYGVPNYAAIGGLSLAGAALNSLAPSGPILSPRAFGEAITTAVKESGLSARSIEFSSDGNFVAAAVQTSSTSSDQEIKVWNASGGSVVTTHPLPRAHSTETLAISPTSDHAAVPVGCDSFDLPSGKERILAGPRPLMAAQSNSRRMLADGNCGPAVIDPESGKPLFTLLDETGQSPMLAAISPDGKCVAGSDLSGRITFWSTSRAVVASVHRLPTLRCQLILDRAAFLPGESVEWRCRLTNQSDKAIPVYASAQSPEQSAITLRLRSIGRLRTPRPSSHLISIAAPTMLAAGASIELRFASPAPGVIAAGQGETYLMDSQSSSDVAYVEYDPPAGAPADAGAKLMSQPVELLRDPGPAFSHPVYSDWIKSADGTIAVRLHLDSALFSGNGNVFVHGQIRNETDHAVTIRVPEDDLYASIRVEGPAGVAPPAKPFSRFPRFITLQPGATSLLYGIVDPDRFPQSAGLGQFEIRYAFHSFGGKNTPNLWTGDIAVPPLRYWRVDHLSDAPAEALGPGQDSSASAGK